MDGGMDRRMGFLCLCAKDERLNGRARSISRNRAIIAYTKCLISISTPSTEWQVQLKLTFGKV